MAKKRLHGMTSAVFIFLFGLAASLCITMQTYNLENAQMHTSVHSIANSRLNIARQLLSQRMAISDTLEAIVINNEGSIDNIDTVIQEIYRYSSPTISTIALAPSGNVSYVYPDEHDSSLRKSLFLSSGSEEFTYSRNTQREMIDIDSENNLLTIYNPIYLREKETGYDDFWGFAIVICPFNSILDDARISELNGSYHYRLTLYSAYNHSTRTIAQSDDNWEDEEAETYQTEEPGYTFTLSIAPVHSWVDVGTVATTAVICLILTILVTLLDISFIHQRQSNKLLQELSSQDSLTKLPNSRSFYSACGLLQQDHRPYTLFFIDANHFKQVNDTFGHETGNEVLCEYAVRLNTVFPNQTYRLGGDEFAALVSAVLDEKQADEKVRQINDAMAKEYTCSGAPIHLSVSTGWAVSDCSLTSQEVLSKADKMMYENKEKFHMQEKK